jgi:hypothetical protein
MATPRFTARIHRKIYQKDTVDPISIKLNCKVVLLPVFNPVIGFYNKINNEFVEVGL